MFNIHEFPKIIFLANSKTRKYNLIESWLGPFKMIKIIQFWAKLLKLFQLCFWHSLKMYLNNVMYIYTRITELQQLTFPVLKNEVVRLNPAISGYGSRAPNPISWFIWTFKWLSLTENQVGPRFLTECPNTQQLLLGRVKEENYC